MTRSPALVRRSLSGGALALAVALAPLSPALAAWAGSGAGSGAGAAAVMPTGATPSAAAAGTSVTVSWTAAPLAGGTVAGYQLSRFSAVNGAPATVGAGCSGVVTATSCIEQSVPAGSWVYAETPVQGNWTGGRSPDSAPVAVP